MSLGRRAFLATVGASLAAPAILRARARTKRYPIAFSTLGCPAWSFKSILDQALHKTGGNKKAAAEMLRLKRTTLSAKVRSLAG
jgi:DNA-binding NtrC family response regulator